MFEHSIFSKIDLEKDKETISKDFLTLIDFANTLNLNSSFFDDIV